MKEELELSRKHLDLLRSIDATLTTALPLLKRVEAYLQHLTMQTPYGEQAVEAIEEAIERVRQA